MEANKIIEQVNGAILTVISKFIELKKSGTSFTACCPFHNEKTPTFSVNPAKGIY
ncbi:MAG: hypothetical protein JEZ14_24710 [Marinilabiliaceae bacterium]|nr:hypothetical protein [Marinilabiliaceae bacterium]